MPASPIRDPYYRRIVEGLEGYIDPPLFENVAVRLLRRVQPGIAALPGGNDRGRDGLIPEWEGEPFPVIVTTGDPLINLTKSLERYETDSDNRDRAVFATSRALTPRRVDQLFTRARERGFTLLAVYQQQDFADWLYRDSTTCRELLGLSGEPAALSPVPATRRSQAEIPLIGRERDLDWLRTTKGDRLVVGQPGSGKTFLLQQLVREGRALFLVRDDDDAVARELRDKYVRQGPSVVLVDDAHAHPGRIERLRRLRNEVEAPFEIVASTWPGYKANLKAVMGDAPDHALELMSRDQLVELYRRLGIPESLDVEIVRELVDQASNRPGLAATLATLWLRGEWREVLTGEALAAHIRGTLGPLLGRDPTPLLGTVALAGSRGIEAGAVSEILERPRDEVWSDLIQIGHAGSLEENGERLVVQPRRLRPVLARDVYIPASGPPLRPYRDVVERLSDVTLIPSRGSDRGAAVEVLAEARGLGGRISNQELRDLVAAYGAPNAWRALAAVDRENAIWALDHFAGEIAQIADIALAKAPEATTRRLLELAARESDEPRGSPYHRPLPVLVDWVQNLDAEGQWTARRRTVATVVVAWLRETGKRHIALEAASIALSPRLQTSKADAGVGMTITHRMGILPPAAIAEMESVWQALRAVFVPLTPETWLSLRRVLEDWMEPEHVAPGLGEAPADAARAFARSVLTDVIQDVADQPALATDVQPLAHRLGVRFDFETDPTLDLLFPPRFDSSDQAKLEEIAARWAAEPVAEVAATLSAYEALAGQIGRHGVEGLFPLAKALASCVEDAAPWASALLDARMRIAVVGPFLDRLADERLPGGDKVLRRALAEHDVASWAAMAVLRAASPPELVDLAVAVVEMRPDLVETACLQRRLPSAVCERLLGSADANLRHAALMGIWNAEPQGDIPMELSGAWEQAVLATTPEAIARDRALTFWFPKILRSVPRLAHRWLAAHAAELYKLHGSVVVAAAAAIGPEARRELVSILPPGATFLLASLVREDTSLYELLLDRNPPVDEPLSPLVYAWAPDDPSWPALARVAAAAGQPARDIAAAVLGTFFYAGTGVDHWQRWEDAFATIARDASGALREAADHGRRMAAERKGEAERQDRRIALQGIH